MPAEGRGLGSRLALEVAKHGRLGQPYQTPLMCESCGRPRMPKRRENLGVGLGSHGRPSGGIGGREQSSRSDYAGVPRPGRLIGWLLVAFRGRRRDVLSESRMR